MKKSPYIGLRPFERNETELFFGREQHTDELIDRLGSQHFLAVIGNSGCGKSSLVKTGLIAGLEAGFLATASSYWRIVEMRPGNHPFQALAEQLFKELNPELSADFTHETLQQRLRLGSLSLHELLAEQPLANNAQLLIVCDQFEELFRYAGQGAGIEAGNFVSLLLASSQAYPISASQTSHSIYVVITMRSDFLGDCAQFAGLAEAINQGLYLTPRLNSQQLRAAIEEPALVRQGEIEPALISQLLEDAETNPDQLPLLQHVLMRLWDLAKTPEIQTKPSPAGEGWVTTAGMQEVEQRKEQLPRGKNVALADYEQLGGLNTALSNHADEAFLSLSKRQRKLAQNLFCQLTGHDNEKRDTRRPLTLHQLHRISNKPYLEVVQVLDVFRQSGCGFLLPPISQPLNEETPEQIIDISHESLIRQWQRLKTWVQEEAEHAEKYQRLVAEAKRRQQGEGFRALQAGSELDEAAKWLQDFNPSPLWAERYITSAADKTTSSLSPWERAGVRENHHASQELNLLTDYIQQSQAAQARTEEEKRLAQQRKIREAQRITGFSIASLLIAAALATWAFTERQHAETEKHNAEATEQRRTEELYQSQLTYASLLAKGEDYLAAKKVLAATYPLDKTIPASKQHQRNLLASFANMKGGEAEQVYEGAGYPLHTLAVSPDGQLLAAAGEHGTLVIFDVKTGKLLQRLRGHSAEGTEQETCVCSITFTANSEQLISAGNDKKIIVWQRSQGNLFSPRVSWLAANKIWAMALSHDGLTFASSGGDDYNVSLWDLATGKLKATLKKHKSAISMGGLSFNATDELLVSASYDGTAIVWQVATGKPVQKLVGHDGPVLAAAFSPAGKVLMTGGHDKTVRLWSIDNGKQISMLNEHTNNVFAVRFFGNDDYLISGSTDRTLRLWDSHSGVSLRLWQGHAAGITQLISHADQMFSSSKDGTVRRWRLALPYQQAVTFPHLADGIAISPDLATVAVGFLNGSLSLYDTLGGQLLWQQEQIHEDRIEQIAFNNTGDLLATGSNNDESAKIWQVNHSVPPRVLLKEHRFSYSLSKAIHAIAFSPDSQTLATARYDGSIDLFPLASPNKAQSINAHQGKVANISFNSAGTQLLSSGYEDRVSKWWDIRSIPATLASELPKANHEIMWSSLSPDNHYISRVGSEGKVNIFNTQTQKTIDLPGHDNKVLKSLFSPDSASLATVSTDATVKLWTIDPASEYFSLRLPTNVENIPDDLWDFDFRCLTFCRVAVPLTERKLLLYTFAYQDPLDFAHDAAEQQRTTLVLWQDYLKLTATLLQQNALPAAQQAFREAETIGKPLREKNPEAPFIQQTTLQSFQQQAELQQRLGNLSEALSAYQQAFYTAEKLLNISHDKPAEFSQLLNIVDDYTKALTANQQTDKISALQQQVLALPLFELSLLKSRIAWAIPLGYQTNVDKDLLKAAGLVDQQNAEELNIIGYNLATLSNRYQEAYPLLKQSITLKPDAPLIMDSFGWLLFKLGKNQEALAYLQAADCKKDQLPKEVLGEVNSHIKAVLKATGKTKAPAWQCKQVQVQNVFSGSQEETLRIQAGDILLSYHGKAVINADEFIKAREHEKPGTAPRTLVVLRQGKTLSFAIKPGKIGVDLIDIDNLPPLPDL